MPTSPQSELARLEALEASGGRCAGPAAFLAMPRAPLAPSQRLEKGAAAGLARAAASGSRAAAEAAAPVVPRFISRTLELLASRRQPSEKLAQFEDALDAIDLVPATGGFAETDSVLDMALQLRQRHAYMKKAVSKHMAGRKVLPPVWWDGTGDDWRAKLDSEAKKQLVRDIF